MREYKFRAWDKKKSKMLYLSPNDTILFKNGKCTVWKENQYNEIEECCCCETFNNVIPMLYSGRKDKNGTLVFDDDILHKEGCWDIRIEFENGVFWVRDANITRYVNKILNTPISDFAIEEFEVIGNIWDNPELLKEESV
jgi:uncharacterized phage protein (TIGR01671 family)